MPGSGFILKFVVFSWTSSLPKDVTRHTIAELRDYVKEKLRDPLVITNPGIPCDEAYLAQAVSNVTCVFVNYEGFDQFELPAPLKVYDPSRFAALPYNIADTETMRLWSRTQSSSGSVISTSPTPNRPNSGARSPATGRPRSTPCLASASSTGTETGTQLV